MITEEELISETKNQIEKKLGWGNSQDWTNQDFLALSKKIQDELQIAVSHVTLKRIWGKVKYTSLPNTFTLNTLVQFIGYENWRDFKVAKAILDIQSNTVLTFTILERDGEPVNISEAVQINMTALRPQLYRLTWVESDGKTVSQIHDYEKGIIHSSWTLASGEFIHRTGMLKPVHT